MKVTNQEMHPLHDISMEDAIDMLIADHKRVANLFAEFKRLTDESNGNEKASVVEMICRELSVHAELEEELFYPAVRNATGDEDQVDEAVVEHAGAKLIIAQLQGAMPDEDLYDARVTVLGEQIDHHVEEEEGSMFPKARHSGLDMQVLGALMMARKAELKGASPTSKPASSMAGKLEGRKNDDIMPRSKARPSPRKKNNVTKAKAAKSKRR